MASDQSLLRIGQYRRIFNEILGIDLPVCDIYKSVGLYKHIIKRHPDCEKYIGCISEIIDSPDYIGKNPGEPNSIEFVKCYDSNILVAVKLDLANEYMYVASLYDLSESKLSRRINSNRLVKFDRF